MDKLTIDSPMIVEIKSLLENARKNVAQQTSTASPSRATMDAASPNRNAEQ